MTTERLYLSWCHIKRDAVNTSLWHAYVPEYDMTESAATPNSAWLALKTAVRAQILSDLQNSLDPSDRRSTNATDWQGLMDAIKGYSVYEKDEADGVIEFGEFVIPITVAVDTESPVSLISEEVLVLYERLFFHETPL